MHNRCVNWLTFVVIVWVHTRDTRIPLLIPLFHGAELTDDVMSRGMKNLTGVIHVGILEVSLKQSHIEFE